MTTHKKTTLIAILLVLVGGAGLVACGGPDPIPVYVTPTPVVEPTATTAPPPIEPDTTLVNALVAQYTITPQPTPPAPPPGVTYGPIVGTDYTPEPLHTALPPTVSVQLCRVIVSAPQVSLYSAPDLTSPITGAASEREKLVVSQVTTDAGGTRWAGTSGGWLPLVEGGAVTAELDSIRACEILSGNTPQTTLLGLHVLNGTKSDAVLSFVRRMLAAGYPVGTVKGLNDSEDLLNEIKRISPQTVIVYRSLLSGEGLRDCPSDFRDTTDPAATARRWLSGLKPYWDRVDADYYEVMNECGATLETITQFSIEAMKIADEQGRCLLLFSFPGGNPDMQAFNQLLPAYQYALDHPCASGRHHGIALHAYSLEDDRMVSESDVWIALRHRIIYQRLLLMLPAAAELPVYLTEVGIGGGTIMPPCDMIIQDALQFTYELEEDPYVKGFHLWSVGTGAQWYDISPCLPELADRLILYYTFSG